MNEVSEVTWCIPCPQHDDLDMRFLIVTTIPFGMTDGQAVAALEHAVRARTDKPITVHKGPVIHFEGHEWAVTIP
jgi:hypothetical protein